MKSQHVLSLSKRILKSLKPHCKKIEITGSIRRKEKNPIDIDVVLIPKNRLSQVRSGSSESQAKAKIIGVLKTKGKFLQGGDKRATFKIEGVKVELYFTTPESWGATLLAYSSRVGASIGLRIVARTKGFKLNQYGLFKRGKYIAGRTEQDIYKALGRPWKPPKKR